MIVDASGAMVAEARVIVTQQSGTQNREATSDVAGHFSFTDVPAGPFQLAVTAPGFSAYEYSAVLLPSQDYVFPLITLPVARADVDVEVTLPLEEIAKEQVKQEEQQRLFSVIPNYYMTFDPHPAPLTSKLKFELAWKTLLDPVAFGLTGAIAGIEQAEDAYGGYGPGSKGYARRYGAAYGDFLTGTMIGGALLPSLFKQDPRYFYKGTGSVKSRTLYAIAFSVMCKGDNGHWQVNYSGILGGLAAGGISNLYYEPQDRNGARLTFENLAIGTGFGAAVNILQEFLFKKITSHVPAQNPPKS
jgi:hypothetical protein